MARIRSIHPGLFTDDNFMELSSDAKILLIGLWTECFDDGIFALKPKSLKAKILPAENVDIDALLAEIEINGFFCKFEVAGKKYGAIHNFRKFQRPKKPNSSEVLPPELAEYVGLPKSSSPPVPHQPPTSTENTIQMEDGGDKMEEVKKEIDKSISKKKIGTRLSNDWIPDRYFINFAISKGLNNEQIKYESNQFKDYWIAKTGSGATKLNWLATWKMWIRRSGKNIPARNNRASSGREDLYDAFSSVASENNGGISGGQGSGNATNPASEQAMVISADNDVVRPLFSGQGKH